MYRYIILSFFRCVDVMFVDIIVPILINVEENARLGRCNDTKIVNVTIKKPTV